MAKKQKNLRQTESIRRTRTSNEILSEIGLDCSNDLRSMGIVLEHIGLSQISVSVLENIAKFSKKYAGLDINLFAQRTVPPTRQVFCPIFQIKDLIGWENPVVTTSVSTTLDAINSHCPRIYHYAFNLDFIEDSHIPDRDIASCFTSRNIVVFTRSDVYKQIIEQEFSIKVSDIIVQDFDIVSIAKMIFERINHASPIKTK